MKASVSARPRMISVEMRDIEKRFGTIPVLDGVKIELTPGRARAIAGENGAGKSTLMKILAGMYRPDAGSITLDGKPVTFSGPRDALRAGISMVHQELTPLRDLPIYENLFLGFEPMRGPFVDIRRMIAEARRMLDELDLDLDLDPRSPARDLSVAQLQLLEVVKAVAVQNASVLLLDEPTSSLNSAETARLQKLIGVLRERGVAIAFTTHRMEELFAFADDVSVLRDGRLIEQDVVTAFDEPRLIRSMVGRELSTMFSSARERPDLTSERDALVVRGLGHPPQFEALDLRVKRGEIVGLAGLIGSGRGELLETMFGLRRAHCGSIEVGGRKVEIANPRDAIASGLAFVGEDRKRSGILPALGVTENVTIGALARFSRAGFLDSRGERAAASGVTNELAVKCSSLAQPVGTLSGGNQQKVVIGKWLVLRPGPNVFLLVEPTRGVDVGAKAQIYALLQSLAAQGAAIVFVSGELPELMALSDRIIVMRKGRIVGDLSREHFSQERIVTLAAGGEYAA